MGELPIWATRRDVRVFESNGFTCCIVRNDMKILSAFVVLPISHPLHGLDSLDLMELGLRRVNGGEWTVSGFVGHLFTTSLDILHMTKGQKFEIIANSGRHGWVLGYNFGHSGDDVPDLEIEIPGHHKTMTYLENNLKNLAAGLRVIDLEDTVITLENIAHRQSEIEEQNSN